MKVIIYSLENYINKEVNYDFNYLDKLNDNKDSMLYENDDLEKTVQIITTIIKKEWTKRFKLRGEMK